MTHQGQTVNKHGQPYPIHSSNIFTSAHYLRCTVNLAGWLTKSGNHHIEGVQLGPTVEHVPSIEGLFSLSAFNVKFFKLSLYWVYNDIIKRFSVEEEVSVGANFSIDFRQTIWHWMSLQQIYKI